MRRIGVLLPVLFAIQVGVSPALAWTWPVDGPVLQQFDFGEDPYAGGQHRGIDVGGPAGAPVLAPAAGTVSFAGAVPGGGQTVTIQTADGYSVTLVHLGGIALTRGAIVEEGQPVGFVGPTGTPEVADPYVHLGIRLTADENGYLDPLLFLPPRGAESPPADPGSAGAVGESDAAGATAQPPAEVAGSTSPSEPPLESPPAIPSAPEGDPMEPTASATTEVPAEAEAGAAVGVADGSPAGASAAEAAEDAPRAEDAPALATGDPAGDSAAGETSAAAEGLTVVRADPGHGAGRAVEAPANSETGSPPRATASSPVGPPVRTTVETPPPNGVEPRSSLEPRRGPEDGRRVEPVVSSAFAGRFEVEMPRGSAAAVDGLAPASGSAPAGPARGAVESTPALSREPRPGEGDLLPWIPALCVAGALLGAALAHRRRPTTLGQCSVVPGAPAPAVPPSGEGIGDVLSESDRLALERELEAILGSSIGAGEPRGHLVADSDVGGSGRKRCGRAFVGGRRGPSGAGAGRAERRPYDSQPQVGSGEGWPSEEIRSGSESSSPSRGRTRAVRGTSAM